MTLQVTPQDLAVAWPKGVPEQGGIDLTLAPWAVGNDDMIEILAASFTLLGEGLQKTQSYLEDGASFRLDPQPPEGNVLRVRFAASAPATDVMAFCLNGIDTMCREVNPALCTGLRVRGSMVRAHRLLAPPPGRLRLMDEGGAPIPPDALPGYQKGVICLALDPGSAGDTETMFDATIACTRLVNLGCFDIAGGAVEAEDTQDYIYNGTGRFGALVGFSGFRGNGSVIPLLIACMARAVGHRVDDPIVMLCHDR